MRTAFTALLLWALAGPAPAATSARKIQFQGKLLDTANNPRNGSFDLTFRLFNVPTAGTALWTETQTGVPVNNGVFEASLGAVTGLKPELFGGASQYLEVEVFPDPPMTPRLPLLLVPVAFRALVADDLTPGNTTYVQVRESVQAGASFNVSSATVSGPFQATGTSTFTASGSQAYSLVTSSGLLVQNGTLVVAGTGGLAAVHSVQAATVSASAGLFLPQGPAVTNEGALRWEPAQNLVFIGTGTSNKTLADTDSPQTLTNKTLNSTGGNLVDATHLRTRSLSNAAPLAGMTLEWDALGSVWEPVYAATISVVATTFRGGNNLSLTANDVFISPLVIPGVMPLSQMRYRVSTAITGNTGDIGLYDTRGVLVASGGANSASFETTAAQVVNMQSAPVVLQPGQYYAAITSNGSGGTARIRADDINTAATGVIKGLGTLSGVGGTALPSSITLSSIVDGNFIIFVGLND